MLNKGLSLIPLVSPSGMFEAGWERWRLRWPQPFTWPEAQ